MKEFKIKQLTLEEAEKELAFTKAQLKKWSVQSYGFAKQMTLILRKSEKYEEAIVKEAEKEGMAYCQCTWNEKDTQFYWILLPKEIAKYIIK